MLNRLVTTKPATNSSNGLITLKNLEAAANMVKKHSGVQREPQIFTYAASNAQNNTFTEIETLNASKFAELVS